MSLGVLNNLSAMYAASNLNNSQNHLSKTLQQLSSGSKINSGADDAAGLSLVNGLGANSTALSQSQTNAAEGVGLLQVADGALSQVTNLLNRAVTLAAEVSNGTLNQSQQTAANQEYKSILAEINNIGSTTTYNQQKVFGAGIVGIYTGDSSSAGSSLNNLNVATLTDTSVGDSGGTLTYDSGKNVFLDLSNGVAQSGNAALTDTLQSTQLTINFKNPDGSSGSVDTNAATTIGGLIAAINGSGRGLTATFTTATAAGASGNVTGTDMGIMITGNINSASGPTTGGLQQLVVKSGGYDTTRSATAVNAGGKDFTDDSTGIAAINYTTGTGSNLTTNDLSSQSSAQAALNTLNTAISNVSAQQGYIGAQINTLNSVSEVVGTQQQNIVAAQNAVQATDYAAAASAMSKYQILSQTGIAALAQANSVQQSVLKLLQ